MGSISLRNVTVPCAEPPVPRPQPRHRRARPARSRRRERGRKIHPAEMPRRPPRAERRRDRPGAGHAHRPGRAGCPARACSTFRFMRPCSRAPRGRARRQGWRVDMVLDEFETPDACGRIPVDRLSGGWQRLALIARAWIAEPDALAARRAHQPSRPREALPARKWITGSARQIPMVIASHDRDFLDACTTRTLFLRPEELDVVRSSLPRPRALCSRSMTMRRRTLRQGAA